MKADTARSFWLARKARIEYQAAVRLDADNLDARRDWGFVGDYVEAMWLMMQQPEPGDYVIATGETHSVREFLERVFDRLKLDWRELVGAGPRYMRPSDVDTLCGDSHRARKLLGWKPRVDFEHLVEMMVDADLELLASAVPQTQAGCDRGRSSCCAMSADRWSATRACCSTSRTRWGCTTGGSRRSCSRRR